LRSYLRNHLIAAIQCHTRTALRARTEQRLPSERPQVVQNLRFTQAFYFIGAAELYCRIGTHMFLFDGRVNLCTQLSKPLHFRRFQWIVFQYPALPPPQAERQR
jgi:hypothetical protein